MIEIVDLKKSFKDKKKGMVEAVKGVTFSCRPGEIFGLLGPNGAGKTTTLRMISTAIHPSAGRGTIGGFDLATQPAEVRRNIGFLSSNTGLYARLTPREVLRYFGNLYGLDRATIDRRTEELSQAFQMTEFLDRPCDKLSTGMKQKTNIARTMLHSPPVMVLDEPTAGLDVLTSRSIVQFIRRCREEQKTVLFSTHIMSEVEKLCDKVAIIHQGKVFYSGTVAELQAQYGGDLEEAFIKIVGEAE